MKTTETLLHFQLEVMTIALFLSLLLLGTPVQSAQDSVSAQRVEKLETRIEGLEARVTQHEIAEGYFDSILTNERTWWTVLITLIVASVGGFTYYKFHERVRVVTEEFEGMRNRLDEVESEFYTTQAMVYKNYAVRNREENPVKAFRDQIRAADSLRKSGEISETEKETLRGDLDYALEDLERAIDISQCVSKELYTQHNRKISELVDFLDDDMEKMAVEIMKKFSDVEICDSEDSDSNRR